MSFKAVNPKKSLPALERGILAFWRSRNIFQKSIDQREKNKQGSKGDYVFLTDRPAPTGCRISGT